MIRHLLFTLPVALLAACNNNNREPVMPPENNIANGMTMTPPAPAPADGNAAYLAKAGAGDLFEIESSRAILAKTDDKAVKDFANMMIDAHGKSTAKLKAAAAQAGIAVAPPRLEPDQQAKLESIKSASAAEATRDYLTAQREAHAAALALHQGYARNGPTPALKTAAGEIAGVVQQHIDRLAKLPK